jgi:hypothetical protein
LGAGPPVGGAVGGDSGESCRGGAGGAGVGVPGFPLPIGFSSITVTRSTKKRVSAKHVEGTPGCSL